MIVPTLDVARMRANITRFHSRVAAAGLAVRAHIKGHRTVEVAREQMRAGAGGIAVTRVAGTREYIRTGIHDIVVAWPWRDPGLLDGFAALAHDCRLAIHVDEPATVPVVDRAAARHAVTIGVRIQIGDGTQDAETIPWERVEAIARSVLAAGHLTLDGVTHYRAIMTRDEAQRRRSLATRGARHVVALAERLRRECCPVDVVAVGGTPAIDGELDGVTELGAGAYALGDAGLARLGICELDAVAVTVPPTGGHLLLDCGQPWCEQAGIRRGNALVPSHICPLILNTPALDCSTGERWTVLNQEDHL